MGLLRVCCVSWVPHSVLARGSCEDVQALAAQASCWLVGLGPAGSIMLVGVGPGQPGHDGLWARADTGTAAELLAGDTWLHRRGLAAVCCQ